MNRKMKQVYIQRVAFTLIRECRLGEDLDAIVFKPLVYNTVRMLRIPTRLAGFGALQDFLDRGFQAFHHMQGADEFIATIVERETRILDRIHASCPKPFAPERDD